MLVIAGDHIHNSKIRFCDMHPEGMYCKCGCGVANYYHSILSKLRPRSDASRRHRFVMCACPTCQRDDRRCPRSLTRRHSCYNSDTHTS